MIIPSLIGHNKACTIFSILEGNIVRFRSNSAAVGRLQQLEEVCIDGRRRETTNSAGRAMPAPKPLCLVPTPDKRVLEISHGTFGHLKEPWWTNSRFMSKKGEGLKANNSPFQQAAVSRTAKGPIERRSQEIQRTQLAETRGIKCSSCLWHAYGRAPKNSGHVEEMK